jgi:hypothetical protein
MALTVAVYIQASAAKAFQVYGNEIITQFFQFSNYRAVPADKLRDIFLGYLDAAKAVIVP